MKRHIAVEARRTARYLALMAILAAGSVLIAQEVIENPAKPLSKDAGRVLKLTEVWRITDEGGEFFFKYPNNLQIAEDGSIFVADADEFLKFSPDGKFLRNIFKKGQGPGELGDYFHYFVFGREIYVQDFNSHRFWRADFDGVFQDQISLANKDYNDFVGVVPDGFLFMRQVLPPPSERTGKLMEIIHTVAVIARDGSFRRDVATFKPRTFLGYQAGMGWDNSITKLDADSKLLFALHSRDYLVEAVDLASGTIIKRFGRDYPKVPHVEKEYEPDFRKRTGAPKIEFEADVKNLYPVGDRLWVETSTEDEAKGRLVDVFDKGGRFADSFYLGAGRTLMAVREDAVFCQQKNEDETIAIVKYRIER